MVRHNHPNPKAVAEPWLCRSAGVNLRQASSARLDETASCPLSDKIVAWTKSQRWAGTATRIPPPPTATGRTVSGASRPRVGSAADGTTYVMSGGHRARRRVLHSWLFKNPVSFHILAWLDCSPSVILKVEHVSTSLQVADARLRPGWPDHPGLSISPRDHDRPGTE